MGCRAAGTKDIELSLGIGFNGCLVGSLQLDVVDADDDMGERIGESFDSYSKFIKMF